jgi:NADH:ubiquinone oxidoreductase subunit 6 (chain J)
MSAGLIVFLILAVIAIAAAVAMLLSSNTVYSALYLIMNFIAVAVIYLTLGAPFVALAQITVYAGAIMVLFLFVIMMLGAEKFGEKEPLKWQRPVAIVLGLALIGEGVYALLSRVGTTMLSNPATEALADPKALAMLLYSKYSLPFEVTSILLLAAAVGAVVLTRGGKKEEQA